MSNQHQSSFSRFAGLRRAAPLLAACLLASMPLRADVEAGIAAYQSGRYPDALNEFLPLGIYGDPRASYYLSLLYGRGLGVPRDEALALRYLVTAANGGHKGAQYNLGNHYNTGRWVPENPTEAAKWWRLSADNGLAVAQYNLASLYLLGRGVEQDIPKAREWYEKAAKAGVPRAAQAIELIDSGEYRQVVARQAAAAREAGQAPPKPAQPVPVPPTPATRPSPSRPTPAAAPASPPDPPAPPAPPARPPRVAVAPPPKAAPAPPRVERVVPKVAQAAPPKQAAAVKEKQRAVPRMPVNHAWLMGQGDDAYTLQIMASDSPETIRRITHTERFARQVAVFAFLRGSRTWYGLTYGRFPDRKSAQAAAGELPRAFRDAKPWARRFGDIKALIGN